tara:strand:- start:3489 stop:3725 length:237 start_codon:yes stop_codon:yes gene_type:complete
MNYFFFRLLNRKLFANNFFNNKDNVKMITGISLSVLMLNYIYSDFSIESCTENYTDNKSYLKNKDISERYREFKLNND